MHALSVALDVDPMQRIAWTAAEIATQALEQIDDPSAVGIAEYDSRHDEMLCRSLRVGSAAGLVDAGGDRH